MKQKVLITGGSGMIGNYLTTMLVARGYAVVHLSRNPVQGRVPAFSWNPTSMTYDSKALEGVTKIINLAGANVAKGRWTKKRKSKILESRITSCRLVNKIVEEAKGSITMVVSASAVGYYGMNGVQESCAETDPAGTDFLAEVCLKWENAIADCTAKTAIIRTGVVLSKSQGALPKMKQPIMLGFGAPLGAGNQPMPWIHINDLCALYIHVLEHKLEGPYNAVAPELQTNVSFTKMLAKKLHKPLWLPNVPAFALKLILGQMANMLLYGVPVSCKKIEKTSFLFTYSTLSKALDNLV